MKNALQKKKKQLAVAPKKKALADRKASLLCRPAGTQIASSSSARSFSRKNYFLGLLKNGC